MSVALQRNIEALHERRLLAEHELTKLTELVAAMAACMDVQLAASAEIEEVKKDVAPEAVLDELDAREEAEKARLNPRHQEPRSRSNPSSDTSCVVLLVLTTDRLAPGFHTIGPALMR